MSEHNIHDPNDEAPPELLASLTNRPEEPVVEYLDLLFPDQPLTPEQTERLEQLRPIFNEPPDEQLQEVLSPLKQTSDMSEARISRMVSNIQKALRAWDDASPKIQPESNDQDGTESKAHPDNVPGAGPSPE